MSEPLPVSVKAVLRCGDRWVLLRNERDEWELPGGRVDPDDASLEVVVRRECREELGLEVEVGPLLDAWLFDVVPGRRVLIVCYSAVVAALDDVVLSDEHVEVGLFADDELDSLTLPENYLAAIRRCGG